MLKNIALLAVSTLALAACQDQAAGGQGGNRSEIRIVGSSTVFPFAKAVAEQFAANGNTSPILESTGTGSGIKLFCAGQGAATPDIVNASRRMKASEFELCGKNGVSQIVELQIGIDGIAIAQSNEGPAISLTPKQIYEAIAENPYGKKNTTQKWSDIDPSLPDTAISVYGPPSTSGTRDALTELIMEAGCKTDAATAALKDNNEDQFKAVCHDIRADSAYVDAGENDNLIVQKLKANPNSIGIFGYSFLEENLDTVRGISVSGVKPTYDAIASGEYPGARPLYIYLKRSHVSIIRQKAIITVVPGLQDYVEAFIAAGDKDGILTKIGLIASPDDVQTKMAAKAKQLPSLNISDLK